MLEKMLDLEIGDKVELTEIPTKDNMKGFGGYTKHFNKLKVGDVGIITGGLMNGIVTVLFDKLHPEVGYSIYFTYPISIFKKAQS